MLASLLARTACDDASTSLRAYSRDEQVDEEEEEAEEDEHARAMCTEEKEPLRIAVVWYEVPFRLTVFIFMFDQRKKVVL
jgi:hypothetical protein